MCAYVNPGNEVLLRDVLAVEELVEVDHGGAWEVEVPLRARGGLCVLALGHGEIVTRPVGVVQEALGAYDSLPSDDQDCVRSRGD